MADDEHALGLPRGHVELRRYDPRWRAAYQRERRTLQSLLGELRPEIEHIGSTAVPGLVAKPVIDVGLAFTARRRLEGARRRLVEAGYEDRGDFGRAGGVVMAKGPASTRTHYLHLVETRSQQWRDYLAFRDALRSDRRLRDRYDALKRELASRFADDRVAYQDGKRRLIEETLAARGPSYTSR